MARKRPQQKPDPAGEVIEGLLGEWLLWALAWCAARALIVVSFADVFGYGEETERACAGKAMLDRLGVPHHELSYRYFEGGAFVFSHLEALAFAMLGPSMLATKVVALLFGGMILGAGWMLCNRIGGRAAARAFALCFVFAPESVQKLSVLALGSHFQALLFVAFVLHAAGRFALDPEARGRAALALGLAAGFGLFFSYQLVLTLVVAAVALARVPRAELTRRQVHIGVSGFLIGISPLVWMASHVGGAVFDIHGIELVGEGDESKLDVLREFFTSVFAGRGALDVCALVGLCAAPLLGFGALRSSRTPVMRLGAWMVLGHAVLFLIVYVGSSFTIGHVYHYFLLSRLTPLWFLAVVFAAIGAAAAWKSPRVAVRAVGWLAVLALAVPGAIDMARLVRNAAAVQPQFDLTDNLNTLQATRGYAYPEYLRKILPHLKGTSAEKLDVFLHFYEPDGDPSQARLHMGIAMALYEDPSRELADIQQEIEAAKTGDPWAFYLGMGPWLRAKSGPGPVARVALARMQPPEFQDALLKSIGITGLGAVATVDRVDHEVQVGIGLELPEAYFVGVGRRMYEVRGDLSIEHYFDMTSGPWMFNRASAFSFAEKQPKAIADALLRGYAAAYRESRIESGS